MINCLFIRLWGSEAECNHLATPTCQHTTLNTRCSTAMYWILLHFEWSYIFGNLSKSFSIISDSLPNTIPGSKLEKENFPTIPTMISYNLLYRKKKFMLKSWGSITLPSQEYVFLSCQYQSLREFVTLNSLFVDHKYFNWITPDEIW